jgi:hypothetical protein
MKVWRSLDVGRWCVMTAMGGVSGRCWVICAENTVVFSAQSLSELVASVLCRVCRRASNLINLSEIHNV